MPEDPVDYVAKTGSTVVFTFTPHTGGIASLSAATLKPVPVGDLPNPTVKDNTATFKMPAGRSLLAIAIDDPASESGELSYTVDGGVKTVLFPDDPTEPLSEMPGEFIGFGN